MKGLFISLLVALGGAGCASLQPATTPSAPQVVDPAKAEGIFAEFTTPRGTILAALHFKTMPLTVASFVGLAEGTLGPAPRKPFFDGLAFHRVVPGFVIQGGDPTGTGSGGPGYRFPDEFAAGLRHDKPGQLSMANSGPDTNGSQFFITLGEARYLDFVHAIFGQVVSGAEVPALIQPGDTMTVKIIRRGREAQRFRADDKAFAELLARAPRTPQPHLVDQTGINSGAEPWQAKYIEYRLTNLARFTGRHVYVRLFASFDPESATQTPQQFSDALFTTLPLPNDAMLACYFAAEDQWVLSVPGRKIAPPTLTPPPAPRTVPSTPDALARLRQNRIYTATGQVVSSLIDQTDPK
jgi:cyclophilin family peptidyl-prolyl cis-trans isomerase